MSSFYKMSKDRRSVYQVQPFESKLAGDSEAEDVKNQARATLYATMLQSPAWMNLSSGAKSLYPYMKMQAYSKTKNKGIKKEYRLNEDQFFFNKAMVKKTYKGLYTNMNSFYKHKNELIENGFIEVVYHSGNPGAKDIYKLSDKWQGVKELKHRRDTSKATAAKAAGNINDTQEGGTVVTNMIP